MTLITRNVYLAEKVIFLDGVSGTGKTMMAPLLGSFERMEVGRFNHLYEYLCALDFLKRIETDAAESLVRMYVDLDLYNVSISREVNLRPKDLSGIFQNPHPLRYLQRLFYKDGGAAEVRIKKEHPILHLISHQALPIMGLIFRTLGDRVRVVEMVRHPLYLLEHWCTYIERFGHDPRDFSIWIQHDQEALPWFAQGWEELYSRSNTIDKVIYTLEYFIHRSEEMLKASSVELQQKILFIPFEHFVLNPSPFLTKIESLLGTTMTPITQQVLRKQKCPRRQVAAGPAKEIYKRYGWQQPIADMSEEAALAKKRQIAANDASPKALEVLDRLSAEYEHQYGRWY